MKKWISATAATLMAAGALTLGTAVPAQAEEATPIAPGAYTFTATGGRQLDVAGVAVRPGANVVTSPARGSAAQSWWVGQVSTGVYRISNVNSGLCLNDAADTATLTQQACTGADEQLWRAIGDRSGIRWQSVASDRVIDAVGGTATTSRALSTATSQVWTLASNRLARVSAWGTALTAGGRSFTEQTVRMVVRPTVTGNAQRLTLSNRFGTAPLTIGAASVGKQSTGLATASAPSTVTFDGAATVTIPAGAEIVSDPVNVPTSPTQNIVVSVYVQGTIAASTFHSQAYTSHAIATGNQTGAAASTAFTTASTSFFFLKGIDVISATASGTVVALGDSITDGYGSTRDGFNSWPAQLAQSSAAAGTERSIVNAGISSNRVTLDSTATTRARGMSAVNRFAYDVAAVPGVTGVYLFEGINDVGDSVSAANLIAGYESIIAQAREAGLEVYGATMTPFNGVAAYTAARELVRTTTNDWILTSDAYDGVLDFSTAVASPTDPTRIAPANDSGDRIHLSPTGYSVLASLALSAAPFN